MPKNNVSDLITDQEMAFARQVLSGGMTDRQAAEAVGLNPDSAAYTKSKPHVRAYMLQHRAAVEQQLVQQEADLSRRAVEELHRVNLEREKVLDRLWEIANLSPEITRGSTAGQVKALSMIIAMQNLIPDRRATSSEKKSAPASSQPEIYVSAWRRGQQATTVDPQPNPAPACGGASEEAAPEIPEPEFAPGRAAEATPDAALRQSTFANPSSPSEIPPRAPYAPGFRFVPDARGPFSSIKNPFVRPR